MAKWKEILSNPTQFPDDFTVSLKDGQTMTLAEMRSYDKEHEGELTQRLTKREQELATREKNVNDASINLASVIERTAAAAGLSVDEFLAGKAPTRKEVAKANEMDESDPIVGSLVKEIKGLRSELGSIKEDVGGLRKNALGPMLNTYLEDYYESAWEKLEPSLPKGATVKREEALKYAQDNGYKDSRGRLDLRKAVKDLTYDARVNAEAEKRASELSKKHEDERILASVPRPGNLGAKVKTDKTLTNEKGQTKNFDEVLNDAMKDTDLWRSVQQVN